MARLSPAILILIIATSAASAQQFRGSIETDFRSNGYEIVIRGDTTEHDESFRILQRVVEALVVPSVLHIQSACDHPKIRPTCRFWPKPSVQRAPSPLRIYDMRRLYASTGPTDLVVPADGRLIRRAPVESQQDDPEQELDLLDYEESRARPRQIIPLPRPDPRVHWKTRCFQLDYTWTKYIRIRCPPNPDRR